MYELIHAERANISVACGCRVLRVSRSGYYQWLRRGPSARSLDDAILAAEVTEVFHEHRGRYSAPRGRHALRRNGRRPSKKRVANVMRALGLRGHTPRRYRRTTDSRHTKRIAPNLLERDFDIAAPNQVLAGDITYISTTDGWLYLAVLLDLYSRRVVGWAMSDRIDTELALGALNVASWRGLEPNWIHHTLCPPSRAAETIREWYESFRTHAERRPTAREALHSGYKPREVHKYYGLWLDFVREMRDLSSDEEAALGADRDFLVALETLEWRKSDQLVLLDALRALGELSGAATLSELTAAYRHRVTRSANLAADVTVDVSDDAALERFLREGPIAAWCARTNQAGQRWFVLEKDTLTSAEGLHGGTAFQTLAAELIEWRLAEYLSRRPQEPILDVMLDAKGEPILKLDRKTYDLPESWVMVVADSAHYRAHYLNHVVDAATKPGGTDNELGALLKRWFGDEAGKRGAQHRVVQRRDAKGALSWKPLRPAQIFDDTGVAIDASFDCEDFEGEPTLVFHSRGGGPLPRNSEYGRGLEILLERLRAHGVHITRIAVESGGTRMLPLATRIIAIEGAAYPIDLSQVPSMNELRRRVGRAAAQLGREAGAKGSGNSTKRLRMWLDRKIDEETLAKPA